MHDIYMFIPYMNKLYILIYIRHKRLLNSCLLNRFHWNKLKSVSIEPRYSMFLETPRWYDSFRIEYTYYLQYVQLYRTVLYIIKRTHKQLSMYCTFRVSVRFYIFTQNIIKDGRHTRKSHNVIKRTVNHHFSSFLVIAIQPGVGCRFWYTVFGFYILVLNTLREKRSWGNPRQGG